MPLKLKILEVVRGQRVVDSGAASEHIEETFHVWVEEPKPRRFKVNLAKASAQDLQTILGNVGAVLLMDVGEMVQQNAHALYLKPNYEIDVLIPAAPVLQPVTDSKPEKIEPVTEKTDIKEPVSVGSTNAGGNRPAQQTR
ncbi:MAG: hypothetical protein RLZ75_1617 [Pseudomonadota bacterium]|jgi:hypothetical protein